MIKIIYPLGNLSQNKIINLQNKFVRPMQRLSKALFSGLLRPRQLNPVSVNFFAGTPKKEGGAKPAGGKPAGEKKEKVNNETLNIS